MLNGTSVMSNHPTPVNLIQYDFAWILSCTVRSPIALRNVCFFNVYVSFNTWQTLIIIVSARLFLYIMLSFQDLTISSEVATLVLVGPLKLILPNIPDYSYDDNETRQYDKP